jgi:hypothetical protein
MRPRRIRDTSPKNKRLEGKRDLAFGGESGVGAAVAVGEEFFSQQRLAPLGLR